jgi:hypothetical protein
VATATHTSAMASARSKREDKAGRKVEGMVSD